MLPFTREQFFGVFRAYNEAVWPVQVGLLAVAIAMVGAARWQKRSAWVSWALAGLWLWTGIAYHLLFFTRINSLAYVFGAAFVAQAALIARAIRRETLSISVPADPVRALAGMVLLLYALVGYPAVAVASGQHYPALPTFGVPCPTVIFTFGLFTWARRPSWSVLVIPVAWAALGISAAGNLGVPEDWGLPVAAIAVLVLRYSRGHRGDRERQPVESVLTGAG